MFLCDLAEFKKKESNDDLYNRSMKGWARNGAIAGAGIGGVASAPLGPVGSAVGAAQGGLYGGLAGATLGAYRNAFRNIKKVAKSKEEERKLRRARVGTAIGTLTPVPLAGSLIGAYT